MRSIPQKLRKDMSQDPYYKTCARAADGGCDGRVTWEHAIEFRGRQLNEKWAIIPLCEYHHSVDKYQDTGGLDKEINVHIAINRATDDELIAVSRSVDYIALRERLNKKYRLGVAAVDQTNHPPNDKK